MMGNFQYLRLYICPPPGNTRASQVALVGSGNHTRLRLAALDRLSGARLSACTGCCTEVSACSFASVLGCYAVGSLRQRVGKQARHTVGHGHGHRRGSRFALSQTQAVGHHLSKLPVRPVGLPENVSSLSPAHSTATGPKQVDVCLSEPFTSSGYPVYR